MPMSRYFLFPIALGKGPTISSPHWTKGQGLERGLRTPLGWWMFGANLWHWSHFLTYSCAFFCMSGHQYPWVMARWDKDLPSVWLSQIPSWSSSRSDYDASGCTQSKYGLEKEHLYNFLSLDIQNRGAFLRTFSTSDFSSGNTSLSRNINIGSIQLGPNLIWWIWSKSLLVGVGAQVFNKYYSWQILCRGSGKSGQRVYMDISISKDIR